MSAMENAFAALASKQAPGGAAPIAGRGQNTPAPQPATAPVTTGAPSGGGASAGDAMERAFSAFAANPALGEPAPIKIPGEFGPYDESESDLFKGPKDKAFSENLARSMGLSSPSHFALNLIPDTWNGIKETGKQLFQRIANDPNKTIEGGVPIIPVLQTGADMGKAFLGHVGELSNQLAAGLDGKLDPSEPRGVHLSRAAGTLLGLLIQIGSLEGGEAASEGAAAKMGEVGDALAKRSVNPGNEMVRANAEKNYMFSKDPGRILRPFKIDGEVAAIRPTFTLQGLQQQIEQLGSRLHTAITDKLAAADTKRAIMPQGTIQSVPNLLDHITPIDQAADETLREIQEDKNLPNRKALIQAVKDSRDDILQDHDIDGSVIQGPPKLKTPTEVNELKKKIGTKGDWGVYATADEAAKADVLNRFTHKAYGKMNELVDTAVGGPNGSTVRELNSHYADLIEFRKLLNKRLALERGTGGLNREIRAGRFAGAAAAILSGHPLLQLGGAAEVVNQMGRSTMGRIVRARAYAAAPRVLPSVGRAAVKAVTAPGVGAAVSIGARRVLAGEEAPQ